MVAQMGACGGRVDTPSRSDSEDAGARLIKRYANRKLYDTRDSRYVTLQQIAERVQRGEDVRIVDNTTKEDLTNVTLAQIIYEQQKKGESPARSLTVLRNLIQTGRDRLMTSLREGPVGKLVTRREDEAHDDGVPEEGPRGPAADEGRKSMVAQSREAFDDLSRLADDRVRALVGAAMGHVQQLQAEVRRLQGRIEELEARLATRHRRGRDSEGPEEQ